MASLSSSSVIPSRRDDFIVMPFCEFFKILIQNCICKLHGRLGIVAFFNLQQKTFPESSCTYSGRFKILNYLKYLFKFAFSSFNILKEGKIINNVYQFSSQVSIFINISKDILSQNFLFLSEIPQTQL
jgi:hypothetical protein